MKHAKFESTHGLHAFLEEILTYCQSNRVRVHTHIAQLHKMYIGIYVTANSFPNACLRHECMCTDCFRYHDANTICEKEYIAFSGDAYLRTHTLASFI